MDDFEERELEKTGSGSQSYYGGFDDGDSSGLSRSFRTLIVIGVIGAVVILAAAAAYYLFRGGFLGLADEGPLPTLIATAVPIERPAIETPAPVDETEDVDIVQEDLWTRIRERNYISVGTSADYPPFASYASDRRLTGLDIAIIQEIGLRLGLEVRIQDIPFEDLARALQINQIDLIISALSVTEERREEYDFSDIYYVSADALLTSADSELTTISNIGQLTGLRVGVQSETVYDKWAQENLVQTNLIPPGNLQKFTSVEDALEALIQGSLDVVAMDLEPAQKAAARSGVRIIGRNLNNQRLAIAVPKGSDELLSRMNQVLFEMKGDGTLTQLIIDHVQLPVEAIQPLPTRTPRPAAVSPSGPTETPFSGCVDAMEYVTDLGPNGGAFFGLEPGESFRTGWRIRNAGTCAWAGDYALEPQGTNVSGVDLGGTSIPVTILTQPGETFDFWVDLIAPTTGGNFVENWSMVNTHFDRAFGESVWVSAQVVLPTATPTLTPTPSQTPPPYISFSANPQEIDEGNCSTLTWSTLNVKAVFLYPLGENWEDFGVVGSGSKEVCPVTSTTYELRVILRNDSIVTRNATIRVISTATPPSIDELTVTPSTITLGECVTIEWSVSGEVNSISLSRDGTVLWPSAPVFGTFEDCPPEAGDVAYIIEATGRGGTSRLQKSIRVEEPTP